MTKSFVSSFNKTRLTRKISEVSLSLSSVGSGAHPHGPAVRCAVEGGQGGGGRVGRVCKSLCHLDS